MFANIVVLFRGFKCRRLASRVNQPMAPMCL